MGYKVVKQGGDIKAYIRLDNEIKIIGIGGTFTEICKLIDTRIMIGGL